MKLIDSFELGRDYEYMAHLTSIKTWVFSETGEKGYIIDMLKEMKEILESEDSLKNVVKEVSNLIDELKKDYPEPEVVIKSKDAEKVQEKISSLLRQIRDSIRRKQIVEVEKQTGLNPDELRKTADNSWSEFIPEETWEKLSEIEKSDFSDAAKCLLLGTATPSVMVVLRGAEASVRNFYLKKTGNEPGTKTWRQLVKDLKDQCEELDIKDTFVGYLDYIGDALRNFAQHPNKIYSLREAVIIFMQVMGLVEAIYSLI